jgi:hypothetical protein
MFKPIAVLILILINANSYASQCEFDQVKLQVLRSGGPEIDDGRASSGYLIWYKNKARVLTRCWHRFEC